MTDMSNIMAQRDSAARVYARGVLNGENETYLSHVLAQFKRLDAICAAHYEQVTGYKAP